MRILLLAATALLVVQAGPARAGSAEANKKLVMDFVQEVFHDRHVEAADKYLAADYRPNAKGVAPGLTGFKRSLAAWFAHVPADLREEVVATVADGDQVVVYQHVTWTDRKTAKPMSAAGFDMFCVRDGKIVEHWDSTSFDL
jgi:predicted SnoaL-like aldol condensation-catalyzing enzyme